MAILFFAMGSSNLCYSEYRDMIVQYLNHNVVHTCSTNVTPSPSKHIEPLKETRAGENGENEQTREYANRHGLLSTEEDTLFVELITVERPEETRKNTFPKNEPISNVLKLPKFFFIKTVELSEYQRIPDRTTSK